MHNVVHAAEFSAIVITSRPLADLQSTRMARFVFALAVVAALAVCQVSAIYVPCDQNAAPVAPTKVSRGSDPQPLVVLYGVGVNTRLRSTGAHRVSEVGCVQGPRG